MKRLLSLFLVFALLMACSKSDPDNPTPEKPNQESVILSSGTNTAPVIATAGGSTNVSFTASSSWSASIINTKADSWCSVSPTSGGAGAATITITVKENTTPDNRSASVVIKVGTATQTIKVEQKQKDALTVTASSFEIPAEGGEIKVATKSNVSFTHTISADAQQWIKAVETKALKDSTLTFEISANDNTDNRIGQIFLASGNLKDTVNVYQAGETPTIVVSQDEYVLKSDGESFEVEVASNVNATMSMVFPQGVEAWIAENTTRAVSTNKFYFTAQANETYDSRTALLIFSNAENNLADTVTVTQAQKDAIVLAKSEYEFGVEGGNLDFEIQTNVDVTVSIPDSCSSWIRQVETRALETKKLFFDVLPADSVSREGKIILTGGGVTQTVKVLQKCVEKIDPTAIPDNEIWYTTKDNSLFGDWSYYKSVCGGEPFDKNIISHTYSNGVGKITFDGSPTRINDYAFSSYGNYTNMPKVLTNIYLPNSIAHIGGGVFGNQEEIETFKVPDSLIEVGGIAFQGTKVVNFIGKNTLPNGEGILSNGVLLALNYDDKAEELIIPEGVIEIGETLTSSLQGFSNRPNIKRLVVSEGVRKIRNSAFQHCASLESVSLPSTLEDVGSYIFRNCKNIREFIGNSKFTTSDNKCFLDIIYVDGQVRYGLQSVVKVGLPDDYIIPEGLVTIRPCAFEGVDNLHSITLPNSIMLIESSGEIFRDCPNFEYIYGRYASEDNKSVVINNCLFCGSTNAMLAFAGKGVKEYTTSKEVNWLGDQLFSYQRDLEKLTISDNVYYIGNYCFAYSPNLKSITLPANLKTFRYDPFIGSDNLETIYFRSPIPPKFEVGGIEQSQYSNLTIYVPEQSLQAYLNDANWKPLHKYMKGYKYDDLYYISTDYSQDSKVTTLQTAIKGNGIDIVLMGDAYSDRQIADGTYKADMENLYNNLFTEEPYKSFKDHFNVYYVNVVSATEGYEYGNTAFDGYFGDGTLVGGNDNAVFQYALKAISEEDMDEALLVVAMNSDNYAGTCYMYHPEGSSDYGTGVSVSYFPKGGDADTFAQLLHHEACGHGFAKLADEYAYEDMGTVSDDYVTQIKTQQSSWGWWKNVDFTNDPAQVRWKKFLEDSRYANDGLGVFEGGLTYWRGVWRPTENSIMRYNTGGFNAPSREAIYYRIHKLAYGSEWVYDYEKFVEYDAVNRNASATVSTKSPSVAHYKPLHPPVVYNKSWRDAEKEN